MIKPNFRPHIETIQYGVESHCMSSLLTCCHLMCSSNSMGTLSNTYHDINTFDAIHKILCKDLIETKIKNVQYIIL